MKREEKQQKGLLLLMYGSLIGPGKQGLENETPRKIDNKGYFSYCVISCD